MPAATWLYARAVVGRYDGWGAWAAAPILLIPATVSALFVGVGLLVRVRPGQDDRPVGDWIAIAVAALPLAWLGLRALSR